MICYKIVTDFGDSLEFLPILVTELIFGATGATGGRVNFLPQNRALLQNPQIGI